MVTDPNGTEGTTSPRGPRGKIGEEAVSVERRRFSAALGSLPWSLAVAFLYPCVVLSVRSILPSAQPFDVVVAIADIALFLEAIRLQVNRRGLPSIHIRENFQYRSFHITSLGRL